MHPPDPGPSLISRGTAAYRRMNAALFLAGFSTFSLLYGVQPLLPAFSREFGVDPATSSLSLSLTTASLALAIVAAGALDQGASRRGLMAASMMGGALLNVAAALAPSWPLLLGARLIEGLALGGVPAVAMAYLAKEMDPRDLGRAMGLYVASTAFGGMTGRVGMGVLTDATSWRVAMGAMGAVGLLAAVGFLALLPSSRPVAARLAAPELRKPVRGWAPLLRHKGLLRLFALGFLLTSVFVSLFNYVGYRLTAEPFGLSQAAIGVLSLTYLLGVVGSGIAGAAADRWGPRIPLLAGVVTMGLGIAVTLSSSVLVILSGVGLATAGYFVAHAVASGWVGRLSGPVKERAASLYLLFYYAGSSLTGSGAGWVWEHGGWTAVVGLTSALTLLGLTLAAGLKDATAPA